MNRVLVVDDDTNLLASLQRTLHRKVELTTAESGPQALEIMDRQGPFALVIADMRMPGMDGIEFLRHVRERSGDTVRMMMTASVDQQTAVDAVNEGRIFHFLCKPCSPETVQSTISAGLEQYRLIAAERDLYSKTLVGCMRMLTNVLSLMHPDAFARASRVHRLARQLAAKLRVERPWEIELAAMVSQFGWILEMIELENFAQESEGSFELIHAGHDLVADIPGLDGVAGADGMARRKKSATRRGEQH